MDFPTSKAYRPRQTRQAASRSSCSRREALSPHEPLVSCADAFHADGIELLRMKGQGDRLIPKLEQDLKRRHESCLSFVQFIVGRRSCSGTDPHRAYTWPLLVNEGLHLKKNAVSHRCWLNLFGTQ